MTMRHIELVTTVSFGKVQRCSLYISQIFGNPFFYSTFVELILNM